MMAPLTGWQLQPQATTEQRSGAVRANQATAPTPCSSIADDSGSSCNDASSKQQPGDANYGKGVTVVAVAQQLLPCNQQQWRHQH